MKKFGFYAVIMATLGLILNTKELFLIGGIHCLLFVAVFLTNKHTDKKRKKSKEKIEFLKMIMNGNNSYQLTKEIYLRRIKDLIFVENKETTYLIGTGLNLDKEELKKIFKELKQELKQEKKWWLYKKKRF